MIVQYIASIIMMDGDMMAFYIQGLNGIPTNLIRLTAPDDYAKLTTTTHMVSRFSITYPTDPAFKFPSWLDLRDITQVRSADERLKILKDDKKVKAHVLKSVTDTVTTIAKNRELFGTVKTHFTRSIREEEYAELVNRAYFAGWFKWSSGKNDDVNMTPTELADARNGLQIVALCYGLQVTSKDLGKLLRYIGRALAILEESDRDVRVFFPPQMDLRKGFLCMFSRSSVIHPTKSATAWWLVFMVEM